MRIGLDIASMTLKRQVDTVILVTGDSDFVPAAKLARREGVEFLGVLQGWERPRRLEPLRAARFEALRAGRSAAIIELCAAARAVLVL
jgi:uncharacterized LabA/DUF88 family protein